MSYDFQLTDTFQKSIKALKKKYPHVKNDLLGYIKALEDHLLEILCLAGTERYGKSGSPALTIPVARRQVS